MKSILKIKTQTKDFLKNHLKYWWIMLPFAAVIFFAYFDTARAAPLFEKLMEDKETAGMIKEIQTNFTVFLQFLSALLWPVLLMIGGLFDNEIIFGGEMGEALLSVWVQVRNLVNIIFVLVLIIIAIYNVLGLGETGPIQQLQLKQILPKFIIALIVVNFSFLGARVFLDFTNVLTTAVFALPVNLEQAGFEQTKGIIEADICRSEDVPLYYEFCDPVAGKFNTKAQNWFKQFDTKNAALVMAIAFGQLAKQKFVREGIENIMNLTFNMIFGIVIYVIYALSFVALFLVLIARIAVLWVLVALSPIIALSIVLPNIIQLGGDKDPKTLFVKHAIAPVKIGIFMSIGYLLFNAMVNTPGLKGGLFSSIRIEKVDAGLLPTGITDLQQLLIALACAVLVWVGVFSAAKDTYAEKITSGIESHAKGLGKFVAKLPLYAQVIPVKGPGGKGFMSIAQFGGLKRKAEAWMQQKGELPTGNPYVERLRKADNPSKVVEAFSDKPEAIIGDTDGRYTMQQKLKILFDVKDEDLKDFASNENKAIEFLYSAKAPQIIRSALKKDRSEFSRAVADYQKEKGAAEEKPAETFEEKNKKIKEDIDKRQPDNLANKPDTPYADLTAKNLIDIRNDLEKIPASIDKIKFLREGEVKINYDYVKDQITVALVINELSTGRPRQLTEGEQKVLGRIAVSNPELAKELENKTKSVNTATENKGT